MPDPTPEQISKLPKWARDHIMHLERQLANEREARRTFGDTSASIVAQEWRTAQSFGLSTGSNIRLRTGPGPRDFIRVSLNLRDGEGVHISCDGILQVLPQASNCINVPKVR